ncbi:Similar to Putative cytochrome P450 CYP13A3; acc. no. Q27517 [Pyronema omphalodes CBS 100304]|uniref:Similar to Putative cytochrome P450 CYP13A3 acc. no. Q27517 n=1 Tax=Pyronema omphalodes (strain CBS 100304) TaxID=1076935 RepID=U4LI45_PYROM|nr:Similar to Putative cytochrome P450 CYP13A3; acc. no. Q27517 [Pyronema omphalodes CBS 100304]
MNPIALLSRDLVTSIIKRLPFGLDEWKYLHFFYRDWEFRTKFQQFDEYGEVFMEVSSGGRACYIGSAEVAQQVFQSRNGFLKDIDFYRVVRVYGDNVLTTAGHQWRHQRKITSRSFTEDVYATAWTEGLSQSSAIISQWMQGKILSGPEESTPGGFVAPATKAMALNLISKAGFGVSLPMVASKSQASETKNKASIGIMDDAYFSADWTPAGHTLSYAEALDMFLENIVLARVIPFGILRRGNNFMRKLAAASDDVGLYMKELVARERSKPSTTLLNALAHDKGLPEQEVIGNLFIFALAGLDTTASTLQFALCLLALNQDVQEWLHRDIKKALEGESEDPAEWNYSQVYPKLVGCLCVIHETLRLHPIILTFPKTTGPSPQPIVYKGKTFIIPEDTNVFVSMPALSYHPSYWGSMPSKFAPQKWDARDPDSGWGNGSELMPGTQLRQPVKGAWAAFSEGTRSCLGKKFALVEMCAFLVMIFGKYRITIAPKEGETQEMAHERVKRVMSESTALISVTMREDVGVKIEKRVS